MTTKQHLQILQLKTSLTNHNKNKIYKTLIIKNISQNTSHYFSQYNI